MLVVTRSLQAEERKYDTEPIEESSSTAIIDDDDDMNEKETLSDIICEDTSFGNFFVKLFHSQANENVKFIKDCLRNLVVPHLSQNNLAFLKQPFVTNEMKESVFQIDALKVPSIDDKPRLFYQHF
ncbi:hypothetical protein J1N35_010475 [Gossypium stocksii]|uniref:Uncharacterized protein n=1 Tax=Gossypium stocksii TaxID=47602 RepID=A0A9D4AAK2_9ROSI|nr:hypothetical protein J1N35_010475 [Gossypium stocksii]